MRSYNIFIRARPIKPLVKDI